MVRTEEEMPPEEVAALHEGLAHPVRVAAYRVVRERREVALAELRRAVAEAGFEVDARSLQFHVGRLERAGLVDVRVDGEGKRRAALLRDVSLRLRLVPGA